MPTNKHLTWLPIEDFSPGLHARYPQDVYSGTLTGPSFIDIPPNSATIMDKAFPLSYGGYRAAFEFGSGSSFHGATMSGVTTTGGAKIIGMGQHDSLPLRSSSGESFDRYLMTYGSSDQTMRLWRYDNTAASPAWAQLTTITFTVGTAGKENETTQTFFVPFLDSTGTLYMLFNLNYDKTTAGTASGLYKIKYSDGVVSQIISATQVTTLAVNQARYLYGVQNSSKLFYGAVGSVASTTSFVDVFPSRGGAAITVLESQEPSIILVGKAGAPWVSIQGDISSATTPLRELDGSKPAGIYPQRLVWAPGGLVWVEPNGDVYLTDGRNFQNLSRDRIPPTMGSVADFANNPYHTFGKAAYINGFLFLPNGYIWHENTGAWFRDSTLAGFTWFHADPAHQLCWGLGGIALNLVGVCETSDGVTLGTHNYSTVWQSAPLKRADGTAGVVREVQVDVRPTATGGGVTNTIQVDLITYDNQATTTVTRTNTIARAVPTQSRFVFPNLKRGAFQVIKVTASTSDTNQEAPMVRRIRVGFAPGADLS